jgi:hypothetical protein
VDEEPNHMAATARKSGSSQIIKKSLAVSMLSKIKLELVSVGMFYTTQTLVHRGINKAQLN